jgi:hypothetical protein
MVGGAARNSLDHQIRGPLIVLKMTGTFLVRYKNGRFFACSKLVLSCATVIFIFSDWKTFQRACDKIFELFRGNTRPKDLSSVFAKLLYQANMFMCLQVILRRTNKIADLLNSFQAIQRKGACKICNYKQGKFCVIYALYLTTYIGNSVAIDLLTKAKLSIVVSRIIMKMYDSSIIFSIFLIQDLFKAFLLQFNSTLRKISNDKLAEQILKEIRYSYQMIFEGCAIFQEIYALNITIIIAANSLYVLYESFEITQVLFISSHNRKMDTYGKKYILLCTLFSVIYAATMVTLAYFNDRIIEEVKVRRMFGVQLYLLIFDSEEEAA